MQSYCNSLTLCSQLSMPQPLLPIPWSREHIYIKERNLKILNQDLNCLPASLDHMNKESL